MESASGGLLLGHEILGVGCICGKGVAVVVGAATGSGPE